MNDKKKIVALLNIITTVLLLAVTVCGVLSFNTTHTFETVNQYGDTMPLQISFVWLFICSAWKG